MRVLPAVLAAAAWFVATSVHADSVTVAPTQDTSIFSGTSGSNSLADGAGPYLWLSVTAEGLNRRALLRFDVSAIPPGALVREVRLSLYESRSRENHAVQVHRLLRAWGEGGSNGGSAGAGALALPGDATWVNAVHPNQGWYAPGGDFAPAPSASIQVGFPGQFYTWGPTGGLSADVQAWVDHPGSNHGWILIGNEQGNQNAKRFESRDNTEASLRPRLEVVYDPPALASDGDIPIPAWALLALTGAFGHRLWRGSVRSRRNSPPPKRPAAH